MPVLIGHRGTRGLEEGSLKVADVMTRDVVVVFDDALVRDVVRTLFSRDISGVPVVDHDGRLVGVVTEADLLTGAAYPARHRGTLGRLVALLRGHDDLERKAEGRIARDVMTAPPVFVRPDESVEVAARLMIESHIKRLPVVERGTRLVGIVSRHDLLQAFAAPGLGAATRPRRSRS